MVYVWNIFLHLSNLCRLSKTKEYWHYANITYVLSVYSISKTNETVICNVSSRLMFGYLSGLHNCVAAGTICSFLCRLKMINKTFSKVDGIVWIYTFVHEMRICSMWVVCVVVWMNQWCKATLNHPPPHEILTYPRECLEWPSHREKMFCKGSYQNWKLN